MKFFSRFVLMVFLLTVFCFPVSVYSAPRIVILATGGTIAGTGESNDSSAYAASKVPVEKLLSAVPEIHKIAHVTGEQVCNISSQDMEAAYWLKLAARIDKLFRLRLADGIVITHGTDTMEETAYFLNLLVGYSKPVVLTGSMRASTSLSPDGPINLLNAIAVAANPESAGRGVMVVMNDRIFPARGITKAGTINPQSFAVPDSGPIGVVNYGKINFLSRAERRHTFESDFRFNMLKEPLPEIAIVYGYAGISPELVKSALNSGIKGLIYAGVGNGNPSEKVLAVLAEARKRGIVIVRASRVFSGPVTLDAEIDDNKYGFIVADRLSPQQARILLMLTIASGYDQKQIQNAFFNY
jgi:L-asparaginase